MTISGNILVFVEDKKGKENKPFKTFSTSISNKQADGTYINKSLEVRFNTENIPQQALNKMDSSKCYVLDVEEAWPSVRSYVAENGDEKKVLYIYINKATVKEAKPVTKVNSNNDLPF